MGRGLLSLYDLAIDNRIEIDDFPAKNLVSFSIMDSDGDCFIAVNRLKLDSAQTEKLVVAHELGHCMTGSFYNVFTPYDIKKRHENRADKWSIMQLVPKDELNKAIAAGLTEVWQLAEYFDVPCDFMAMSIHWYQYHNMDWTS